MSVETTLDGLHAWTRRQRWLGWFTVFTRVLIAIGFIPSGMTKVLGNRFTLLGPETSIGYFFDALYQTGFYWRFIGGCQVLAALLLLVPRTTTLGAVLFFPIILNIFVVTVSLQFRGTPIITGLMLLATVYLLWWDYDRLKPILRRHA
ncbi:MAG: DoxX family membrane protein [Planctomycetota bacterium]